MMNYLRSTFPTVSAVVPTNKEKAPEKSREVFIWNGKPHMVPLSFRFPRLDVRQLFDSWWGGYNFIEEDSTTNPNKLIYCIGPLN